MSLTVRVIAPDKTVWDATADEVILPSTTGQVGILTGHAPLVTALDIAVMQVKSGKDKWTKIALMGGFAEVDNNEVTVLVNGAELGSNIDASAAKAELAEAEKLAGSAGSKQAELEAAQAVKKAKAKVLAAA
jgi:F-type H+-transporting ATPase subunit epsilon